MINIFNVRNLAHMYIPVTYHTCDHIVKKVLIPKIIASIFINSSSNFLNLNNYVRKRKYQDAYFAS